ncbi:NAD(+) diphosphatase [Pelomonas sp. BJYL3]|uniref:NAD(+) diphosphatase n=1 Tax=Pelomonas sp. BJYL3 TaxID=2976697 RepID=UPI0022B3C99C|nr:NAD(+) diphosphatase [Pelomonas sp. BJYL3]
MDDTPGFIPGIEAPATPSAQGWHLVFVEGQLLIHAERQGLTPQPDAFTSPAERHYLGRLDGLDCWTQQSSSVPEGWEPQGLRAAMMQMDASLLQLAGRAAQVMEWDRAHRFCGVCGTPTERQAQERARRCPSCGHVSYPRISPAMMALVWRRHQGRPQLLLARSPNFKPGFYSALAGFVEAGESLESCLHREVAEEVGVRVRGLHYYASQSWPFPHSLMLAFRCEWAGGEIREQPGEIEHADWFELDALPGLPPRFSIAGHLIGDTIAWLQAGGDLDAAQARA